ncbi:hypothetical protein ACFL4G_07905 [Thermodesulfobacteriota bacterium]
MEPIVYKDAIEGKDGKPVERTWKVLPDPEHGFGGPTTIGTLFEVFQIWNEEGFRERQINFGSIYKLLDRKYKSKGRENYKGMVRDLETLAGLEFDAINSFWDSEKRAYVDIKRFKLFDYVALYKDSPKGQASLPFSFLMASELLWDSVNKQSFFPVGIQRELFHAFKPLEQRLALYLEKVFRSQHMHRRDIFKLAEQLPIQSKTAKHIKSTLRRACDGLIGKGYERLSAFEFKKSADRRSENIVFHRAGTLDLPLGLKKKTRKESYQVEALVGEMVAALDDEEGRGFYTLVAQKIPSNAIYMFLSEIKLESRESGIRNKGAVFTIKIKRYAQEQGIDLGLNEPEADGVEGRREGRGPTKMRPGPFQKTDKEQVVQEIDSSKNESEDQDIEDFYQSLSQEEKGDVDTLAEARLPDFLKERLREARYKGEESFGVMMSLNANRNEILKDMKKALEEG